MNFPIRDFENSKFRQAFPVTQFNRQKRLRIDIALPILVRRQLVKRRKVQFYYATI